MESLPSEETIKSAVQVSAARLRHQHELAVQFATAVLRLHSPDALMAEACAIVSQGLRSRFVKVLRYMPESESFLLEAGVGWDPSLVGTLELGADDASPAGFAYSCGRPVLSNHLGGEHRFRTPELLAAHGIKRAINVPIRGVPQTYGVLEADSADDEDFIETDIVFLEGVANVISMSRERLAAEAHREPDELFSTTVLNASTDCIQVLSLDGRVEFVNDSALAQFDLDPLSSAEAQHCCDMWPDEERRHVDTALRRALEGEANRFEARCPARGGDDHWWDVSVAPVRDEGGEVRRIVFALRDVTERHANEQKLIALVSSQESQLGDSALMMKEVHHRVRNSLQLVHTLLALQGNLAGDQVVAAQLQAAATRVMTVGSVHQRLYEDNGAQATDAGEYLKGLIHDLSGLATDRELLLDAPSLVLPAARLAPLGLVAAELITNALKYGRGTVRIALARAGASLRLTVEDEGDGFPEDFPKPRGTGLGMRLVRTYAGQGPSAVSVDRSVPFSRIVVTFPAS